MAASSFDAGVNATIRNSTVSTILKLDVHETDSKLTFILTASVCFVVTLIGIFCAVFIKLRKERKYRKELAVVENTLHTDPLLLQNLDPDRPLDEQAEYLPYYNKFEIPREDVRMGQTLGRGNFGKVVKGDACIDNQRTAVAIKMCTERRNATDEKKQFIEEIKIMIHIGRHRNIVNILGAVTIDYENGPCLMILEYCQYGSLLSYLQRHREHGRFLSAVDELGAPIPIPKVEMELIKRRMQEALPAGDRHVLTTDDLNYFAFQISNGMAYLSEKSVIHRDLAARNILVADHDTVKIADFGLSRPENDGLYVVREDSKTQLPFLWIAPESHIEREFSTKSDVWSFGILLWEMFSLGNGVPYSGTNLRTRVHKQQFIDSLADGTLRLARADLAPGSMYRIMLDCWNILPKDRPDFECLSLRLEEYLDSNLLHRYAEISAPYEQYNANFRAEQQEYLNNSHFRAGVQ